MLVDINLTGPSYQSRSLPISAQVTRNFYPELQDVESVKSKFVLQSFPGLKVFSPTPGKDRGMYEHDGSLYKVTDQTLYKIDSLGNSTEIGTITGTARCVFTGMKRNVIIVSGGVVWEYDGTDLTHITDINLENPNAAAFLNNQIIYDGIDDRWVSSDVGDASSINGLNYASAESHHDPLVRPYVFNQTLYLMGTDTIEPWYNKGVGSPPFDRIEGGIMTIGLGALHSVSSNDKFMYFLGDDSQIHRVFGNTEESISTIAIAHAMEKYSTIADAIGFCFTLEGQNFYYLTFGEADNTWVYAEDPNQWFELSSGVKGGKYSPTTFAFAFRKNFVADDENIYEWDEDTFENNGEIIQRTRDSGPFHGGLVKAPGKTIEMNHFELIMETGTGLIQGQGSDPFIMLSMSDDGGETFSTEMWGQVGQLGKGIFKVEWSALGSFMSRVFRIRTSDPIHYSIHSATADIEIGI
jgi:hypothetical protein